MHRASDINGGKVAKRFTRFIATCALALVSATALAGPPAGTVIPNQATATAMQGVTPLTGSSNIVTLTTSAPVVVGVFSATLVSSANVMSDAGATVFIPHTLTNTGTSADTYTLAAVDQNRDYSFTSITLFADANGDGQPDSAVPLAGPIALAPGAAFRFVARLVVPAGATPLMNGVARISATSTGGSVITPDIDTVTIIQRGVADCAVIGKVLSRYSGPSPASPVTVTLSYNVCDKARAKIILSDVIPAGMRYIAGSGRFAGTGATPLTDAVVGADRQGTGTEIGYDYNVTTAGAVTATVFNVPANTFGYVNFDVEIDAGLAIGTTIPNRAMYTLYDASGNWSARDYTNTVNYLVTGRVDVELTGQRLPSAVPGTTVAFTNVLTNRGSATETFDIALAGSTFPVGTTIALFKSDGTTPLADTDGNGTPDTGPVAPGATYNIVVRVRIPETAPPAAYKVTKTARAASAPTRSASADDAVDTLASKCALVLEPDNQATIGRGQHVTYTHYLTNRGNCTEKVEAMLDYLRDSKAGWVSAAYIDNKVAGAGSIPGALDAADTRVARGWSATLAPGENLRILVDVLAPEAQKAAQAKSTVETNVTTLVLTSSGSGNLTVRDTTILDDKDSPAEPDNAIRNFTDSTYAVPTVWGVVGGNLWLRANAASCNAAPNEIESRTVVITGPGGEREEVIAVETGPNTGIFSVAALPVRDPPVVAGDRIIEGRANDSYDVEIIGCGRRIATVVTLMAPVSVVFDSHTNEPVAGATVTLVGASGGRCGTTAVGNPVVTAADGHFAFPPTSSGSFCLVVQPPNGYRFPSQVAWTLLPGPRNLNVTGLTSGGSYGSAFPLGPGGLVVIDIPVDGVAQDGLFVQKDASRSTAEVGEFIDYTVRVRNGTGNGLDRADVMLTDNLPAGFAYMAGTARRDGKAIADPAGGKGPRLVLALGHLDRGEQVGVTYRVRIGPGAMQGDGINRAQASYSAAGSTTLSNVATAKVLVTGGVFSDKGFIVGRIYMDCNANGLQDRGELGVPAVRIILEDGTYVITDGGGKFSFYGISNRTHVVKVDATTLPPGARLEAMSARHLGDGRSRIVDLKAGEMARADFAIAGCDESVVDDVKARVAAAVKGDELAVMAGTQLATEARVITDVKAQPASGVIAASQTTPMPGAPDVASSQTGATGTALPNGAKSSVVPAQNGATVTAPAKAGVQSVAPSSAPAFSATVTAPAQAGVSNAAQSALEPLEKLVPTLDNTLAFVGLTDGQTVAYAQSAIRVKGSAGSVFKLTVNGVEVSDKQVGKRAVLADKQVQAWEYIGVELRPGENTLGVAQIDSFGNPRGTQSIRVIAPDKLARLVIELPAAGGIADGKTPVKVVVKLVDHNGVPVTVRTAVTLESSLGKWQAEDLDAAEPGLQQFIENGRGEFLVTPPLEPGASRIVAASGAFKAEARLDFLPELRNMIATGVIEGIVNVRNINTRSLVPTRASDGFEQEIRHLSRDFNGGKMDAGARAAFYLKGKIKGEYLLTAAYDSDKDTQERLFRDIQPDEFYPIYGDSAQRGYDAQSTSRLYVRIDNKRSYLLWGDFTTNSTSEVRKLTNYSRSLTGIKEHYENSRVSVNAFASRDSTRQVIEELRANGTSGPFQLGTQGALINSEKVEIVTRDRNQPALIISALPLGRFSDYEIEVLTGRILFKAPVPSVDRDLNPVFIRVTYEVDQGGEQFWVVGVDGSIKVTDRVEIGAVYVKDKNPLLPFTLAGANMVVKVGEGTYVISEAAHSVTGLQDEKGNAYRIEVKHESANLKGTAFYAHTDRGFENPGAYLTTGRGEAGGRLEYKLSPRTTIKAEALRSEDVTTNAVRDGMALSLQHQLGERLTLELGVRHAAEKGTGTTSPVPPIAGQPAPQPMPDEVTTVRARVTGSLPFVKNASVYGEVEVDVKDTDRKVVALGGEYTMENKGRLYARHEFISSITGPYGLNQTERQNTTAIGIDTEYMKDGRLFSEYRIRDAMSGGDVEAAVGLRNLWSIAPGLRLGTTFERVQAISGTGQNENTALALALEYTGSPLWKGSTRLELRDAATQQSLLFTVGLAARLNRDWTALARNAYSITRNKGATAGEHVIERMQAGLAWRDSETNKFNVLARVEHRLEEDNSQENLHLHTATSLVSINADWQLARPFLVTGRYAAKWTSDTSNGLSTKYRAQVVGARGTWEFAPKWDVSLVSSALFGDSTASRQYGVGIEVGYLVATNFWVSAGYNFFGYRDADLAGADYTAKGAYVRMRYKFDESLFDGGSSAANNKVMNKTATEAAK